MKKGLSETCHRFFSVLSNPTRLAALETLMEGSMNVSQLAESLGQEQSMVSHNLRPLVRCRFVEVERRGKDTLRVFAPLGGAVWRGRGESSEEEDRGDR
jgi:DNA-binding transcriptional ArsR family regulator